MNECIHSSVFGLSMQDLASHQNTTTLILLSIYHIPCTGTQSALSMLFLVLSEDLRWNFVKEDERARQYELEISHDCTKMYFFMA